MELKQLNWIIYIGLRSLIAGGKKRGMPFPQVCYQLSSFLSCRHSPIIIPERLTEKQLGEKGEKKKKSLTATVNLLGKGTNIQKLWDKLLFSVRIFAVLCWSMLLSYDVLKKLESAAHHSFIYLILLDFLVNEVICRFSVKFKGWNLPVFKYLLFYSEDLSQAKTVCNKCKASKCFILQHFFLVSYLRFLNCFCFYL